MTGPQSPTDDAARTPPDEDLVELRVPLRREHLEWLERRRVVDGDASVEDTLRRIVDQAPLDDDILVARALAAGFAAVAAELAEQYRRDRRTGDREIPGETAALDLTYAEKRCRQARGRDGLLDPSGSHHWAPLPTETAPDLATDVEDTVMLVAVRESKAVRAEMRSEAARGERR